MDSLSLGMDLANTAEPISVIGNIVMIWHTKGKTCSIHRTYKEVRLAERVLLALSDYPAG
jgi:hypothetical protein